MSQLVNKLALITGASSGIGLASSKLFAKNGASLALVDISTKVNDLAKEIQETAKSSGTNIEVSAHVCDVTNKSQVEEVFKKIKAQHNQIKIPNVVVNSAGIATLSSILNMSEEMFDETIKINLKGTFLVTQAAIKELVKTYPNTKFNSPLQTHGSIIQLASMAARAGGPNASHYASTKAGLTGFIRSVSQEVGVFRIRCNAVLPYFIHTPMIDVLDDAKKKFYTNKVPLGRFGEPEEVANLCLFLASDASSYITGTSIEIAGGV